MPYIKAEDRKKFDKIFATIGTQNFESEGELNYFITCLCDIFIIRNDGLSYKNINTITGILECVKQEFYRKVAAPYEDKKCEENGKVSIYDIGE